MKVKFSLKHKKQYIVSPLNEYLVVRRPRNKRVWYHRRKRGNIAAATSRMKTSSPPGLQRAIESVGMGREPLPPAEGRRAHHRVQREWQNGKRAAATSRMKTSSPPGLGRAAEWEESRRHQQNEDELTTRSRESGGMGIEPPPLAE